MAKKKKGVGITPKTRSEIEEILDEGEALDIALLAQEHSQSAIDTLAAAMDPDVEEDDRPPWSVSTKAANDMIQIGHGRSAVREAPKEEGGITVVINELTVNHATEKSFSATQIRKELQDATTIDLEKVEGGTED